MRHLAVTETWSTWSSYGACSVSCGDGVKIRTRTCSTVQGDCDVKLEHSAASCNDGLCTGDYRHHSLFAI